MQPVNASGSAPRRARIALFDNIKGVLIALVVFGHMMHPVHNDNPALSAVFDVIYLFHMPMFVLVSGLFAKSAYRGGRLNVDRVISFLVLGVAFQLALLLVNGAPVTLIKLLRFPSAPWYLIAMAWWSAATPLLSKLGARRGLAVSLVLAMLVGFVELEQGFLAISRTLAFLPWFALGYYLKPDDLLRLRESRILKGAVALAEAIACLRVLDADAYQAFLPMAYGDNPYEGNPLAGIATRAVAMLVALIFSLAMLKLVPARRCRLTTLGQRTLQVYLLHRLIRAALTFRASFYDMALLASPVAGTAAILVLSACTIVLCSSRRLEKPVNALLNIKWTKLLDNPSSPRPSKD